MIVLTPQEIIDKCPRRILNKIAKDELGLLGKQPSEGKELPEQSSSSVITKLHQLIVSTLSTPETSRFIQEGRASSSAPLQNISININDVILDVENLPQVQYQSHQSRQGQLSNYSLNQDIDVGVLSGDDEEEEEESVDPEVAEYLKFKKDHQLKFLKEVKQRGLILKRGGEGRQGEGQVGQSQTNKFMNY
ncbi:hypothetical protein I9W82_001795 [Candida metapsilosis]|uniref:Uncharacterized protein n=1 Tax=Candida metapsilosis TaxID=273372 RepID=A0A8H8DCI0_9ASCO|nr:hypothetical protein I9W82_001795 [Candida metapsilosis]